MDATGSTSDELRDARAEEAWWYSLAALYNRRRLLLSGAVIIGLVSIGVSLVLPKWYQGVARVMMPQTINRAELAMSMGDIGPAAAAFLSGSTGDFNRYQTILQSRTVRERLVRSFDLIAVYGLENKKAPMEAALERLDKLIGISHDVEFDYLIISVLDRDPGRSAEMTNFLVDELNRVNAELQSANAARNRSYLERRYQAVESDLDSIRAALQEFQEIHGVVELEQQTEAFMTMVAEYRTEALLGEVEYEALRRSYGSGNPLVESAYNRIRAARQKERELRNGASPLLPVSFSELPERLQEFAELKQEALIRARMVEIVRPLLEKARFEEIKATPAVQVLDRAQIPYEKAKPRRSLIVIGLTFAGCVILPAFVLMQAWWRYNRKRIRNQF